ncbi:MAG: IS66 family transposase [Candidatus Omnitrophica bacterium]|nr:IS66 family transposase [Candidatus Omnitrophota bacterium]MBU4487711.1 IS66 family transposase [Candidatus Omnitrophota bacterium]MCG2705817.1 IS66 family transposase [Candidatus Omnitrophota bacterium]
MSDKEIKRILLKLKILEEENEKLKEENAYLKFKLEDLQSKRYKSKKIKPPDDTPSVPSVAKKRGGLFGHIGWFRKKPKEINRIEEVRLDKCPKCGSGDLIECKDTHEHIQEDIILPKVEVTLYRKHRYYCKNCKEIISPKGADEIPGSCIGPRAKAFAAFLRFGIKISERDVCVFFQRAFNLKMAASSIAGFMDQLKTEALPIYNDLLASLKKGSFIHADETGWSIDGINHWLWKFSNKKICVSHIDKARGQAVVEKMLGDKYNGVLISDFLSAYNKIITPAKQRCLVHILRDLEKVMEYWHDDREVLRYSERLKKIFEDAIQLYKEYKGRIWDDTYCRQRELIAKAMEDFEFPNPNKRILRRFAKRLKRHKNELFTFLYIKNIDYHNNHAEQQIRPDVIFRKITFGNRSLAGAENHSVIMSILQTAKLNGIDPIGVVEKILLRSPQNPLAKAFYP